MSHDKIITDLLGLQGWEVVDQGIGIEGESVVVSIRRRPDSGYRCRGCGQMFLFCHDHLESRRVRDFPVWGRRCYLEFTEARVHCPQCGVLVEALDFVSLHKDKRFFLYVAYSVPHANNEFGREAGKRPLVVKKITTYLKTTRTKLEYWG